MCCDGIFLLPSLDQFKDCNAVSWCFVAQTEIKPREKGRASCVQQLRKTDRLVCQPQGLYYAKEGLEELVRERERETLRRGAETFCQPVNYCYDYCCVWVTNAGAFIAIRIFVINEHFLLKLKLLGI